MPQPMGDLTYTWPFAVGALLAYLIGSIPFGLVLTKLAGYGDIRAIGSGNIGATNVLRTGNKTLAALTLALDAAKGAIVVLIAKQFGPDMTAYAAICAFLGHLFPVWLGFKGGKGVATYIGLLLGLYWPAALIFCAIWLLVAFAFRYSSLAALVASALTPAALWFLGRPDTALLFLLLSALLWIMHRANIGRLVAGSEGKIGATTRA